MRRPIVLILAVAAATAACAGPEQADPAIGAPTATGPTSTTPARPTSSVPPRPSSSTTGLTLAPLPPSAAAPPVDPTVEAALAAVAATGVDAVVAISRSGGEITVTDFGRYRDDGMMPDEVLVDVGSITKTVTGVLVARAVDDGLVRLDETLGEIFPAAPADKAGITVLQLLTHDAGLVDAIGDDAEVLSRQQFVDRVFATPLAEAPGDGYDYSNVGYGMLAAILEERSGVPYDAYLENVLVDMTIGYAGVYDDGRSARATDGRTVQDASWGGHDASWNLVGNGGLVARPSAIIRLRQDIARGAVLSPEMVAALQQPYIPEGPGAATSYGFGLVVDQRPKVGTLLWHDGGNDVFSAFWLDVPDRDDVIFVAASNSERGDAITVINALAGELYGITV